MISLLNADALHIPLTDETVQTVVTSPPYYGLRDYGISGQLGLERTFEEYIEKMVMVFREVWRVLRKDGTVWLNIGDSYAGSNQGFMSDGTQVGGIKQSTNVGSVTIKSKRMERDYSRWGGGNLRETGNLKPKDLIGIPWRVAFALQADGWWLRSDIIWSKPNPMPESVTDRPTKSHEYLFLLSKSHHYFYDAEAIREPQIDFKRGANGEHIGWDDDERVEPGNRRGTGSNIDRNGNKRAYNPAGRNRRTVWEIATTSYSGAHFATFPPDLVRPCILAGTSPKACEHCGAPWERIIEKGFTDHTGDTESEYPQGTTAKRLALLRQAARKNGGEYANNKSTLGWRPTCKCENNTGVGRCLVIDPFAGTATVGLVAGEYGRNFVGLELKPEYILLALKRTRQARLQEVISF